MFPIPFIGEGNAGKTTLINALLGGMWDKSYIYLKMIIILIVDFFPMVWKRQHWYEHILDMIPMSTMDLVQTHLHV